MKNDLSWSEEICLRPFRHRTLIGWSPLTITGDAAKGVDFVGVRLETFQVV